jgi:NAD+ diphosphatase
MAHPVLAEADEAPVFLGLDEDGGRSSRPMCHPGCPTMSTRRRWAPSSTAACRRTPSEDDSGAGFAELRGIMAALSPRDAELAATARGVLQWHATHRHCARCGGESARAGGMAAALRHLRRGAFPAHRPGGDHADHPWDRVLVGRSPGWPERMYSLLAGFVEPGETVEDAVRREVLEESGVRVGPVRYLASQPWPFPASLMLGCHGIAETTEITVDPRGTGRCALGRPVGDAGGLHGPPSRDRGRAAGGDRAFPAAGVAGRQA